MNLRLPLRRKPAAPAIDAVSAIHGAEALQLGRGARIYATDGPAATLRQVVADDATGEIVALVVTANGADHSVLMPLEPVHRSAGGALFLGMTRAQFARSAALAPRYVPGAFEAVAPKRLLAAAGAAGDPVRRIASASADEVTLVTPGAAPEPLPFPVTRIAKASGEGRHGVAGAGRGA